MTALPATHYVRTLCHQTEEPCRNCQTVFRGNFCPECGQEAATGAPTTLEFIYEFLTRNILERGKLPRTLWHLLRYPGGLTVDFLEGRRQRFIRPVRLYLGLSVLYFLVLSLQSSSYLNDYGWNGAKPIVPPGSASASTAASVSAHTAASQSAAQAPATRVDSAAAKANKPANIDQAFEKVVEGSKGDQTVRQALEKANVPAAIMQEIEKERKIAAARDKQKGRTGTVIQIDDSSDFLDKWPDTGWRGRIKHQVKYYSKIPGEQAKGIVIAGLLNQAPKAMFFLVPVFALLLKLSFMLRKIPYGAHLVFAFHYHALLFLGLLVLLVLPLPEPVMAIIWIAVTLYFPLSMRRIYGGGWISTIMRWGVMSLLYPVAIMLVLLFALMLVILA